MLTSPKAPPLSRSRTSALLLAGVVFASIAQPAQAEEWPAYRADPARSGRTANRLEFPLVLLWQYEPSQASRPAWPEPGKERQRLDFDYCHHPVIAGGLVVLGSTVDDTVRALEAATGQLKWSFTTDGPVRFAPHVAGKLVYVASDDGFLYCLHLTSGKLKWRSRGGIRDDRVIGNGRMISRWPLRAGVLVDGGAAYFVAGMWPSEGIFIYALRADTGEVIWCNDTSGCQFMSQPHRGAYALTGLTPQGYLAASEKVLIVPTGRGLPVQFDRGTGKRLEVDNARMINRHTGKFFRFDDSPLILRGGPWITVVEEKGMFLSGFAGRLAGFSLHGYRVPSLAEIKARPYPLSWSYFDRAVVTEEALFGATSGKALAGMPGWPYLPDRALELILAGNVLVAGGKGFLQAYETSGCRKVLDEKLDGEVRGLAVADGRLVVSTREGVIHCLGPEATGAPERVTGAVSEPVRSASSEGEDLARMMVERKTTRGYALVVDAEDARIAESLARQTGFHAIVLLSDQDKVASERRRLLPSTALYGSRIVIHHHEDFARLPFGPYFANLVVVAGTHGTISGKELYRVLRPCGGVMCFVGAAEAGADKWIKNAEAPDGEVGTWQGAPVVTRGRLPGALDWDSATKVDKRVKWPLELLWFGEPGPAKMADRHWRPHTPVPANGRYFVVGQHHVIAVDAYNGTVLWEQEIHDALTRNNAVIRALRVNPLVSPATLESLYANAESVYVDVGGLYIQFDAQTGEVMAVFGDLAEPQSISLEEPHVFRLKVDEEHTGAIEVSQDDQGLKLVLRTVDPEVTGLDSWELFFDFRPANKRFGFYGRGTFQVMIPIGKVLSRRGKEKAFEVRNGAGIAHPRFVAERRQTDRGVEVTLALPWDEMTKLCGQRPRGFGFTATLASNDGAKGQRLTFTHLAGRKRARVLNDGWPILTFGPVRKGESVPNPLKELVRPLADMPEAARTWSQRPPKEAPVHSGVEGERTHPITGQRTPKVCQKSYGCRPPVASAAMMITRSSTLGYYDFEDDSGFRNFGGVRPGCGGGLLPALGLLISNESSSGCGCGYSFQTSVALAPATRRSNEDWALFYDRFPDDDLKHISLNLGAPGDRREDKQKLWLAFPRSRIAPDDPHPNCTGILAMEIPVTAEGLDGFGPDRHNADRITVENTTRPWVYASYYRGLKSLRFDLRAHAPWGSLSTSAPPVIDGRLSDTCWREVHPLMFTSAAPVRLRHDKEHLYVAFTRQAPADADGRAVPWRKTVLKDDGDVWKDDAFELYITDGEHYHPKARPRRTKACVHLGVSASGARYDGLYQHTKLKQDKTENKAWTAPWNVKVRTDAETFSGEFAVPWKALADAGVKLDAPLHIVAGKHLGAFWHDFWAWRGFRHVALDDRAVKPDRYTVRLHFAEPDDVRAGQRVFDVVLQANVVARDVDIFRMAGGRNRALMKEFRDVSAKRELTLELRSQPGATTAKTVPLLSGVEVFRQESPGY